MLNREMLKQILGEAADPDKAQTALLRLNDEAEQLFADYDRIQGDSAAKDERIRSLQDTNQSLFLRVTGGAKEEDEDEDDKTPEQVLNDLVKLIGGNEDA